MQHRFSLSCLLLLLWGAPLLSAQTLSRAARVNEADVPHLFRNVSGITEAAFENGIEFQVGSSTTVELHGFARIDYTNGDHVPDAAGDDELGVSKLALETDVDYEDFKLVTVIGSTIASNSPADTSFKDIFCVWSAVGGSDASVRFGAQPILFGLKPAGYPGDRTLFPTIEFGGAGAFAVSNQAGPSVIGEYPLEGFGRVEAGLFDSTQTTAGAGGSLEGSGVFKNYFVQLRFEDVGVEGLYGSVGYEGLYIGQTSGGTRVDDTEPIFDVGVGYGNEHFDLSVEYVSVSDLVAETADDESYVVVELTGFLGQSWTGIVDYAMAEELDASTTRVGAIYDLNDHVSFHVEYAHDEMDGASDLDSFQGRVTVGF